MTPHEFYDGFVLENCEEWQRRPDSIRLAFNAAVAVSHLADHYCFYHIRHSAKFARQYGGKKGLERSRILLEHREPHFKLVQDMANAYKHLYTRTSCSVSSAGSIESVKHAGKTIEPGLFDETANRYEIIIRTRGGTRRRFADAIDAVLKMHPPMVTLCAKAD